MMDTNVDVTVKRASTEEEFKEGAAMLTYNEPWITYQRTYEYSLEKVMDLSRELYVAVIGEKVAGCILLEIGGQLNGFIRSVCTADGYRGKGIGTKLLAFAEKRIFAEAANVFIFVSSFNERARKLYASLGYEQVGLFKDYVLEGYDEYLFRKTIGSSNGFTAKK